MPRQLLNELNDGDSVEEVYLLAEKQLRANRNANLYLLANLRDRTGAISGLMWNVTEDSVSHVNSGDYVRVKGKVQRYQGALQMIVTFIEPVSANGLDPAEFQPESGQDVGPLLGRMKEILLTIEDRHVRTAMECFLDDEPFMQEFCSTPAGVKAHHAYRGGLLEHVVSLLELADRVAGLYPKIDRSLLLAGAFLHDIGKTREMTCEPTFLYTDEGQLLGHLIVGVEMLDEKLAEAEKRTGEPCPAGTALRLKHMIVSHHGTYQFGSPKLPMTPEAIALHHLDNLDAKVHEFTRAIDDDLNDQTSWTPFIPRLERKLYKGDNSEAARASNA